jgi:molybdenum cofactor synthesis domain-containing protein
MFPNQIRVVTGCVAERRSKTTDELGRVVGDELRKAEMDVRRHVVVKGEAEHITALINNVSVDNEADVLILMGGSGFGPKDNATEAVTRICDHQIEGFAEAFRKQLKGDVQPHKAMLARAAAGVCNKCLVFSLSGKLEDVRLAVETLIAPALPEALELAYGRENLPRE